MKYVKLLLTLSSTLVLLACGSINLNDQISIAESIGRQADIGASDSLNKYRSISSPDGQYSAIPFELNDERLGITRHILLKNTKQMRSILIDPNPGGIVSASVQMQFVANDNLIVSWGCGTFCQMASLFSLDGNLLTKLYMHSVSPNLRTAATFAFINKDKNIRLIDLRTGKTLLSQQVGRHWHACSAKWTAFHVELKSCVENMQPDYLLLKIPNSGQN
jgi:hypothetical protein